MQIFVTLLGLLATALVPSPKSLHVGSLTLHRCAGVRAYCGTIARPLDPAGTIRGEIPIGFTYLPHRDAQGTAAGTILAMEGGPGYPSGASFAAYAKAFGPLLQRWNLLLVDDRGTGRSGALLCSPLQEASVMTLVDVARCGRTLGKRADLYGTALASDDVAAVLDALHVRNVTLYGDSYGTFMAQTFAGRHPKRVRAIVLDGAYPVVGSDPWLSSVAPQARRAFDLVCRRSAACARLPGSSMTRVGQLLDRLRRPGAPVTPSQLAFAMASAGLDMVAYEDLDAAARAYLAGDRVPLRQLVAEAYRYEEQNGTDAKTFSAALFVASTCSDDPEPYDMTLPPSAREAEWHRVVAARERSDPEMDAPFTISEFLGMPPDYGYVDLCVQWPVASAQHPSREPLLPDPRLPNVPVLVLVGDLDTITTPAESAAAAKLFADSTYVVVRNTGHVTAIGDVYDCASRIVRRFIVTLHAGSTSCTKRIPALPTVAAYELRTTPHFTERDAALAAARDVLARVEAYGMHRGNGLRGGTFSVRTTGRRTTILLNGVRWAQDAPVWGSLRFDESTGWVRLHAVLSNRRVVTASWNAYHR